MFDDVAGALACGYGYGAAGPAPYGGGGGVTLACVTGGLTMGGTRGTGEGTAGEYGLCGEPAESAESGESLAGGVGNLILT